MEEKRITPRLIELTRQMAEAVSEFHSIKIPEDDLYEIVHKFGGDIEKSIMMDPFGYGQLLKIDNKHFKIILPSSLTEERERYLIGLQLGNLFLHMGFEVDENKWNQFKNISYNFTDYHSMFLSREFALTFLMPKGILKKKIEQYTMNNQVPIKEVANYFELPTDIVRKRAMDLRLIIGF